MQITQGRQPMVLVIVFAVVCVVSALALVKTKHESRKLFVELESLTSERDQLKAQLAATQARVELAERAQKRAIIKTPFPCRIEEVDVEVTQAVSPGQALAIAYDVAVAEDYGLVDKIHRGIDCGIERKVLVGRNEPGVQNMHRQLHEVLGAA